MSGGPQAAQEEVELERGWMANHFIAVRDRVVLGQHLGDEVGHRLAVEVAHAQRHQTLLGVDVGFDVFGVLYGVHGGSGRPPPETFIIVDSVGAVCPQ